MPQSPISLGQMFTSQSNLQAPPVDRGYDYSGIANTIGRVISSIGAYGADAPNRAKVAEEVRRSQAEANARKTLGQMIAGLGQTDPIDVRNQAFGNGVAYDTMDQPQLASGEQVIPLASPDQQLAAERSVAARNFNPANVAAIAGQGVEAGTAGSGANIGNLLSLVGVANRDADTVAGLRSSAMAPGTQVFQSGADQRAVVEDAAKVTAQTADLANRTAMNDADGNIALKVANIGAQASMANNAATNAVTEKRIEADDRASRNALETERGKRVNGQEVRSAVNGALGIRNNEDVVMGPEVKQALIARTEALLAADPNMTANTAATQAASELLREDTQGNKRRFQLRRGAGADIGGDIGASVGAMFAAPSPAASPAAAGGVPRGAMVDDETGEIFDAQGKLIGRLPGR